jgi:predicted phosphoadenosine phosphosulfate sulfurtransferase
MNNPFEIDSPTCISFSGGRTSAYMLHKVLQEGGGNCQTKPLFVLPILAKKKKQPLNLYTIVQ